MRQAPNSRSRTRGFSLIEATVALGICATGVLLIVGLLPITLSSLAESADRNALARIRQGVASRYAMMDWHLLEDRARDGTTEEFHFDFQGSMVDASDPEMAYSSLVTVGPRRTLSGDNDDNRFLRILNIRVSNTPEHPDALTDEAFYETLVVSLGNEAKLKFKYRD